MIVVTREIIAKDGKWDLIVDGDIVGHGGYCQESDCPGCEGLWTTWGESISLRDLRTALGTL